MATPWNSATAYSNGNIVSYRGLDYVRSQYPDTATSGTPPNEEMSVDTFGVDIRTWTLDAGNILIIPAFATYYFRTAVPPVDSKGNPQFSYAGASSHKANAYSGTPMSEDYQPGETIEWDQFTDNASPTPDSPVCPSNQCGVALQQGALGQPQVRVSSLPASSGSRTRRVFVRFNHPLFFRRTITVLTIIQVTTEQPDPDPPVVTYQMTYTPYTPDDRNYTELVISSDYFVAANAAFSVTVPVDTAEVSYAFAGALVAGVEGGD